MLSNRAGLQSILSKEIVAACGSSPSGLDLAEQRLEADRNLLMVSTATVLMVMSLGKFSTVITVATVATANHPQGIRATQHAQGITICLELPCAKSGYLIRYTERRRRLPARCGL